MKSLIFVNFQVTFSSYWFHRSMLACCEKSLFVSWDNPIVALIVYRVAYVLYYCVKLIFLLTHNETLCKLCSPSTALSNLMRRISKKLVHRRARDCFAFLAMKQFKIECSIDGLMDFSLVCFRDNTLNPKWRPI
jgi:hypothetical protein